MGLSGPSRKTFAIGATVLAATTAGVLAQDQALLRGYGFDAIATPGRATLLEARFVTADATRASVANRPVTVRVEDRAFLTRTDAQGIARIRVQAPVTAGSVPVSFTLNGSVLEGTRTSALARLHVVSGTRPAVLVDIDTILVRTDRGIVAKTNAVGTLRSLAQANEIVYVAEGQTRDPEFRRALSLQHFPSGPVIEVGPTRTRATRVQELTAAGVPIRGALAGDGDRGLAYRGAGVMPEVAPRFDRPEPVTPTSLAPAAVSGTFSIVDAELGPVGSLELRDGSARRVDQVGTVLGKASSTSKDDLAIDYSKVRSGGAKAVIEGVLAETRTDTVRDAYRWDAIEGAFRGKHAGRAESLRRARGGNAVDLLIDGTSMLPACVDAIRSAKRTVHVETYIWGDDRSGRAIAAALVERARAGVKVRAILDGVGSMKTKDLQRDMRSAGIEVVVYNPLGFKNVTRSIFEVLGGLLHLTDLRGVDGSLDANADNRDHRKALVVDSRVAFVGGIGFFDDNVEKWHDLHARMRGPAVGDVQRHFEEVWKIGGGRSLGDAAELYPSLAAEGSLAVDVVTTVPGVHDELKRVYLSRLRTAQRELLIENPYFTDSEVVDAVKSAARRGVKTTVILPPDDDNDVKLVGAHHTTTRVALLAAGVDLRAYPRMTHGKVAVVDGKWGTIGSANLDNRSLTRNLEENLSIDDPRFASDLKEQVFRPDVLRSKKWSPADKPTGFMKKAMAFVSKIFEDWL